MLDRSLRLRLMSTKNKEKALDVVKDGLGDLNDAVEAFKFPGVTTVYSVGAWIAHKWEVRLFEDFLQRVRMRLDLNREQLLREMRDNRDKKWMAEGLARGWRLSLEAMNETARECAYFLVADYIAQKKEPDPLHRQISTFLMEADKPLLKVVRKISSAKMAIGGQFAAVTQSVLHAATGGERFYEVQGGSGHYKLLEGIDDPERLHMACDLLTRAGLMSVWSGHMELQHAREELGVRLVYGQIKHYQADSWKHLHRYLDPVDAA